MTFPEAGLQVLETSGKPMTYQEITARAIHDGLLSHVGQIPEQTMRERLSELAHRTRDRRLSVVGRDSFALTDWGLPEDEGALALLGAPEAVPEGPPYRSRERHPPIGAPRGGRLETGAAAGRRRKRLPPLPEVVGTVLGEAGRPLPVEEILSAARERGLIGEDLSADTLLNAIAEENRRRIEIGRRAAFSVGESGAVELLQVGAEPAPEAEARRPSARVAQQTSESRRSAAHLVRRRLSELDATGLERVATTLLDRSGYRDLRPVRRAGEGQPALLIARRRLGLTDIRFVVRLATPGAELSREDIQELRRDMAAQGAHAGMVLGPVDVGREARAEAGIASAPLVILLCGEALADELVLREVGVTTYELYSVDASFWRSFPRAPAGKPAPAPAHPPAPAEAPPAPPQAAAEPGPEPAAVESAAVTAPPAAEPAAAALPPRQAEAIAEPAEAAPVAAEPPSTESK